MRKVTILQGKSRVNLGLAIVRQGAMSYDGEAKAVDRAGGGLEVSMCFPQG